MQWSEITSTEEPQYVPKETLTQWNKNRFGENFDESTMNEEELAKSHPASALNYVAPDPGIFEGSIDGTLKGFVYGLGRTTNTLMKVTGGMVDYESANEFLKEYGAELSPEAVERQKENAANFQKSFRASLNKNFGSHPEEMGIVGQVMHGVFSTIPEAVAYTMAFGPTGGALAFGADMGVNRYDELRDKGVDEQTAKRLGWESAILNAIGVRIPPALGSSRLQSVAYGAGSNAGLNFAEISSIKWTLENQDYEKIAKEYDFSVKDALVSGALGAVMGGVFYKGKPTEKSTSKKATDEQVAAARMAVVDKVNNLKNRLFTKKDATPEERIETERASEEATLKAAEQMLNGEPVDTSAEVGKMNTDPVTIETANKSFGKTIQTDDADDSTIVVLQNRDRSTVSSINQVNSIASNPVYGRLSTSRDSASGSPIVSFGTKKIEAMPDDRFGNTEVVYLNDGTQVPVQYAVMEAADVEASNGALGDANPEYAKPENINVVSGNGRMAGLKESYRRGSADGYKEEMANDKAHGISSETIKSMKEPVLVRIMPKSDVTTKFIEESNNTQILAKNDVETAHQDAPLIRSKMQNYTFDDNGNPTSDTVRMFLEDINEIGSLGNYLTADGRPNENAVRRINSAVFYEAYRSDALTALFSDTDNNIRRVLNAMASLAPRIIELRNKGIDIGPSLIEGANAIKSARDNGTFGKDAGEQMDLFGNDASLPFASVLVENANSAVAIRNIIGKALDFARNSIEAQNDPLFPAEKIDVADVSKFLRDVQNEIRVAQGKFELPPVDMKAIRKQLKEAQKAADALVKISEVAAKEAESAPAPEAVEARKANSAAALDSKTALDARINDILMDNPNEMAKIQQDNGDIVTLSAKEVVDMANAEIARAENEANGIGQAVMCILENKGV